MMGFAFIMLYFVILKDSIAQNSPVQQIEKKEVDNKSSNFFGRRHNDAGTNIFLKHCV